jgi:hypothetical protein
LFEDQKDGRKQANHEEKNALQLDKKRAGQVFHSEKIAAPAAEINPESAPDSRHLTPAQMILCCECECIIGNAL